MFSRRIFHAVGSAVAVQNFRGTFAVLPRPFGEARLAPGERAR